MHEGSCGSVRSVGESVGNKQSRRGHVLFGPTGAQSEREDGGWDKHKESRAGGDCPCREPSIQKAASRVSSRGECKTAQAEVGREDTPAETIFSVKLQQRG